MPNAIKHKQQSSQMLLKCAAALTTVQQINKLVLTDTVVISESKNKNILNN